MPNKSVIQSIEMSQNFGKYQFSMGQFFNFAEILYLYLEIFFYIFQKFSIINRLYIRNPFRLTASVAFISSAHQHIAGNPFVSRVYGLDWTRTIEIFMRKSKTISNRQTRRNYVPTACNFMKWVPVTQWNSVFFSFF